MNGNISLSLWHFEILQGPKLECYQGDCQIANQSNNSKYKYHSYNTARSYNKTSYQILKQLYGCHTDDVMWDENAMLVIIVINSLRPRQNRRHFADDIFKCILLNENVWIALKISLEFVRINNIPALVQIMAWRRPGNKPLSEPMTVSSLTHICVTQPQWVKQSGTKPNLVAKIWPPNLVTICAWLPKLVANINSQFQHLVNMGLDLGILVKWLLKWLPIMVAHTCKLDTIWVVYISPIGNHSILL